MNHMFVLFVNDNGFVGNNDSIVLNVGAARHFDSREEAEKHRIELCSSKRITISILEWL